MSDDIGPGILFGVLIGYAIWGTEPAFIDNLMADADSEYGEPAVLQKFGSGQVAVFHGFVSDLEACELARQRIEAEGGMYACSPASEVAGGSPWWKFW